jgi:hypothetical protein
MRNTMMGIAVMAMLMGIPAGARAQTAPPPAQTAPPAQGTPAKPVPDWWDHSSLAAAEVPTWRWHVDATVGTMWANGNTDGYSVNTGTGLVSRRNRWTNRFDLSSARRKMTYGLGGGSDNVSQHTLRDRLEYDLTPHALALVGFEYFKDNLMFIDDRATYFAGGGVTVFDTTQQKLNLLGGIGYARFDFDVEGMSAINPVAVAGLPTDTPNSAGVMGLEAWQYTLSNHVTLNENASVMKYTNNDVGHEWTFGASVTVPITRRLSLVPAYSARDETNIYVEALDIRELDQTFNIGVKVSF